MDSRQSMYARHVDQTFKVPEDGTFFDDNGNPFLYFRGNDIPVEAALRFSAFRAAMANAEGGQEFDQSGRSQGRDDR